MTDWDNISEEEGKKKYASMMLNLISFTEAGELDEFAEDIVEDINKELQSGNSHLYDLLKKAQKQGVIVTIKDCHASWKWNKWWEKE